jgi:hypothetical protein
MNDVFVFAVESASSVENDGDCKKDDDEKFDEDFEAKRVRLDNDLDTRVEEKDSGAVETEEVEGEESDLEEVTKSEWDWARDKCRKTIRAVLRDERHVRRVSDDELDEFVTKRLLEIENAFDSFDADDFRDSKMLNNCCELLGFGGGILDIYTILSFADRY